MQSRYQIRREKRKLEGRCTRCGIELPEGHKIVNCDKCNALAIESTKNRRERLKDGKCTKRK